MTTATKARARAILFSGPMIRAILDGTKSQTRRVVKPQPNVVHAIYSDASIQTNLLFRRADQHIHCPYGKAGDSLWCRETWGIVDTLNNIPIYRADIEPDDPTQHLKWLDTVWRHWKPSIHMPRAYSRINLEVVSVRVERVQDITEEDAEAEGMAQWAKASCSRLPEDELYARSYFELAWNSINGKRYPWDSNPFVWVIEFRKVLS